MEQASSQESSDPDIALVRKAIDSLRRGSASKATEIEASISDPAARKLVEWMILRSDNSGAGSTRYPSFIAANPSWPSLAIFRRYAEEMLWHEDVKPAQVLRFFKDAAAAIGQRPACPGARAHRAGRHRSRGRAGARSLARRRDVRRRRKQVLESYSELLSRADHKARMEKRLFVADHEAAMRAAHRLGGADLAIARAHIALNGKAGNLAKLLDAVPAEAHQDRRLHVRARASSAASKQDRRSGAGDARPRRTMLRAMYDPEEWWVERRILSRKLLDSGDTDPPTVVVARCRRADQRELPRRAPFHGGLDRAAVPQ